MCGIHVSSCLQRVTAIQNRRLSEYNCYVHGTQGPPGNKFDLASAVIRKLSDKRMKLPRSNINAVFGRVVYGLLGCTVLGISRYMYLGQDNK